jgi:hypothetical protein
MSRSDYFIPAEKLRVPPTGNGEKASSGKRAQSKTRKPKKKGYDPAYCEENLNLGKAIRCPELVIVALIRQRYWWNVDHGKSEDLIELGNVTLAKYGVSRHQKFRVLRAMERAGWIQLATVERKSIRIKLFKLL